MKHIKQNTSLSWCSVVEQLDNGHAVVLIASGTKPVQIHPESPGHKFLKELNEHANTKLGNIGWQLAIGDIKDAVTQTLFL